MIDFAIQNNKILYNTGRNKISQLNFKREVANVYSQRYKTMSWGTGKPFTSSFSSDSRISDSIRFEIIDHLVQQTKDKKRKDVLIKDANS